jgi:hypothetical protein
MVAAFWYKRQLVCQKDGMKKPHVFMVLGLKSGHPKVTMQRFYATLGKSPRNYAIVVRLPDPNSPNCGSDDKDKPAA